MPYRATERGKIASLSEYTLMGPEFLIVPEYFLRV